jgi:alpha-tubulin suppressor-like RCC1 family protein
MKKRAFPFCSTASVTAMVTASMVIGCGAPVEGATGSVESDVESPATLKVEKVVAEGQRVYAYVRTAEGSLAIYTWGRDSGEIGLGGQPRNLGSPRLVDGREPIPVATTDAAIQRARNHGFPSARGVRFECGDLSPRKADSADGEYSAACRGWNNLFGQHGPFGRAAKPAPLTFTAGENHLCARVKLHNGEGGAPDQYGVECWGRNHMGQAGMDPGGFFSSDCLLSECNANGLIVALEKPTSVHATANATCALQEDGQVLCWGSNEDGILGRDWALDSQWDHEPQAVAGRYQQLAAGRNTVCAIGAENPEQTANLSGGKLHCWGQVPFLYRRFPPESGGGFPNHVFSTPQLIAENSNWVDVAVGDDFVCGVLSGGALHCLGSDEYGQLGGHALPGSGWVKINIVAPA